MGRKKNTPRRAPLQSFYSGTAAVLIWSSGKAAKAFSSDFRRAIMDVSRRTRLMARGHQR
jgi:hypothetical protein